MAERRGFVYELRGHPEDCAKADRIIRRALIAAGYIPPRPKPKPRHLHVVPDPPPRAADYAVDDQPMENA